jgi:hypothetical protein
MRYRWILLILLAAMPAFAQQRGTAPEAAAKPAPRTADGKPDLSGMWMSGGGGGGGRRNEAAPYNAEAAAKARELRERLNVDDPIARCLLVGVPRITTMPMPFKIIQLPAEVVIVYEAFRGIRVIPTDGRGHPDDMEPGFLGDSIGKWEGDTLVVDVLGFNGRTWLGYGASHHSDALHVTERYTRTDYNTIRYEVTMEDPKVFTKPWSVHSTITLRPDERIREYECIDNNQAPENVEKILKSKQ